jgi:hypothetical protein
MNQDQNRSPEIRCQLSPILIKFQEKGCLTKLSRTKKVREIMTLIMIAEAKIDGIIIDLRRYWKSRDEFSNLVSGYRL